MKVDLFDYYLPEELIAQTQAFPRDASRLMVINPQEKTIENKIFRDLLEELEKGDVLVLNHTKVIPARLYGEKDTGAKIEILLIKELSKDVWQVLAKPGKKLQVGDRLSFGDNQDLRCTCLDVENSGERILKFYYEGDFSEHLDMLGEMPLPPYIETKLQGLEREKYQTVYNLEGSSVAAPTAGLHFTREMLEAIKDKGVIITSLLLDVGIGTFRPVKVEDTDDHEMHEEYYEISEECASIIETAKKEGRRIIAVGTTSVRVLETVFKEHGRCLATKGWTNIFIEPGYKFLAIDALLTNFHLPKSTLLMLISALGGREFILHCYEEAVKDKYRFFSFGDSMLIKNKIEV